MFVHDNAFDSLGMVDEDGNVGSGITIPAGVTTIGDYAFNGALIPAIYFSGTTPATIGTDVFTDCITPDNTPTPIYVPCSAVDTYKAAAGWSTYADQIQCIPDPDPSQEYFHFISLKDGSQIKANSKFQYSLDGGNTWTAGDNAMKTLNSGATIHFKGINSTALGANPFGFTSGSTGAVEVRGNIMSLAYGDAFKQNTVIPANNFFEGLFHIDSLLGSRTRVLRKADKLVLPATSLTNSCYANMFNHCASLTTAPELPATALASSCYNSMFAYCNSLTSAPALPVTTLANGCYSYMFAACKTLTSAPELPATTLESNCYSSMFNDCTLLTSAPELPATTLKTGCYSNMFRNCSSLNYIKAMFTTTPSTSYTGSWVDGVASSGTFVKNANATWDVRGVNGIPNAWTVETAEP